MRNSEGKKGAHPSPSTPPPPLITPATQARTHALYNSPITLCTLLCPEATPKRSVPFLLPPPLVNWLYDLPLNTAICFGLSAK